MLVFSDVVNGELVIIINNTNNNNDNDDDNNHNRNTSVRRPGENAAGRKGH